jgi:tRNA threonylcarbamoyladenosine biosynthesis protein TsaE
LWGGLGSGKTTLVQGICSGLEVIDDVVSPSFALINQYRGRLNVYHIDLYRINADNEVSSLGLEECFYGNGVSLVEWPERAGSLLPEERLDVRMRWIGENTRNLELIPKGNAWDERFSN